MLVVGITGGVSSGKSAALAAMRKRGARVLDCDAIAHALLGPGTREHRAVVRRFGAAVCVGGRLDRGELRRFVLADPNRLAFLERTLHPGVKRRVRGAIDAVRRKKGVFAVEVPLLFETGMDRWMDRTVALDASASRRVRWASRRGMTARDFRAFSARQWAPRRKAARADFVVRNTGSLSALRAQARRIFVRLSTEAGTRLKQKAQ